MYTRNGTQNVTYTNRKTLLSNDMFIYTRYVNTDMTTDQLFIQMGRGLMHIIQGTTFGWIVMEKEAGRYQVGKGRG